MGSSRLSERHGAGANGSPLQPGCPPSPPRADQHDATRDPFRVRVLFRLSKRFCKFCMFIAYFVVQLSHPVLHKGLCNQVAMAQSVSREALGSLLRSPSQIRNMFILAHVDHGKTS
jgi:hypothetical protein